MDLGKNFFNNLNKEKISGLNDELVSFYVDTLYKNKHKEIIFVASTFSEANKIFNYLKKINENVLFFPMDDFLTSVLSIKSPEFKTMRVDTLNMLSKDNHKIIVTHLMGFLKHIPGKNEWLNRNLVINKNQEIDMATLVKQLIESGYQKDSIVTNTGEIAVRGFVLDFFPVGEINPIRLEFFGDTIENIKYFDAETQRTIESLNKVIIYPFDENIGKENEKASLLNYFKKPIIIYKNYNQILASYKILTEDILTFDKHLIKVSKYMNELENLKVVEERFLSTIDNDEDAIFFNVTSPKKEFGGNWINIKKYINDCFLENKKVAMCVNNKTLINSLSKIEVPLNFIDNLNKIKLKTINVLKLELNNGFMVNDLIILTEKELLNENNKIDVIKRGYRYGSKIRDIHSLSVGDYVVHDSYGIGIYQGLITLEKETIKKDYILVIYKGGDKLYIPVEKINLLSKYSSKEGTMPKINKLGGIEWQNIKRNLRKKISGIAAKLIKLYAERESQKGFAFDEDTEEQIIFESGFEYELTIDQKKSVIDIKKDMEKEKPMDRLLCGDVGYGKTEVAFRAMFKAVCNSKQVVLLCPTTILAIQHYKNALNRFRDFPIKIVVLSRFTTPKETKIILEELKTGKIDIVIGTHKLLNKNIIFKCLGLLVVDEEQRFGVAHKEQIKSLKVNVDVLTLSATPIPRTLQMSLNGIRELSVIETPPMDRQPVQTYVLEERKEIIIDAIYKEISRNGQSFVLYNNVKHIERKMKDLQKLIPDMRICFIHGQMPKKNIENTLQDFISQKYDVLLCTTIIETGIDMPNVNTLIILDANNFGLSQLYQIRGRVGRSDKIAYAYLMYDGNKSLNENAMKRLKSIREFTALGSGMAIAMRDLAIRGAGDLLGSEQAGFIDAVGIDLYNRILRQEIDKIKGVDVIKEEETDLKPIVEVDTHIEDHYVMDEDVKIEIHSKINDIDSYEKLKEVRKELIDRFGEVSSKLEIYMHEELLEKLVPKFGIEEIRNYLNKMEIIFSKDASNLMSMQDLLEKMQKIKDKIEIHYKNKRLMIGFNPKNFNKHWLYVILDILKMIKGK